MHDVKTSTARIMHCVFKSCAGHRKLTEPCQARTELNRAGPAIQIVLAQFGQVWSGSVRQAFTLSKPGQNCSNWHPLESK